MKFGNHLLQKQKEASAEWKEYFINYNKLKQYIKTDIASYSIHFSPEKMKWKPENNELDFASDLSFRLGKLQNNTSIFIKTLDEEVEKLSGFFDRNVKSITEEYQNINKTNDLVTCKSLLKKIITLEQFIMLNYTGIVKIMKKLDRHSGLKLSEPYMFRLVYLPFYHSEELSTIKHNLMDKLSGTDTTTTPEEKSAPLLTMPSILTKLDQVFIPPSSIMPQHNILIQLSGKHGTDIIGCVLESMAKFNCTIIDFMLSRLYHNVTFGVLVRLSDESVDIFNHLSENARKWDAVLSFQIQDEREKIKHLLDEAPYDNRLKYTATVLNQNGLTSQFLNDWTKLLLETKISVEKMNRLSKDKHLNSIDFSLSVPNDLDFDDLRQRLFQLSAQHGTDVALQNLNVFRKNKRLVVFDMDSTLIRQEVIDEIAKHAGVVDEVAKITASAMNGEIDFKESLRRRVALLKGTPVSVLDDIKKVLTFTEGAHFLCKSLKRLGYKLAVISGGFMPLATYVKHELGLDYAFANQLRVSKDGLTLTGETYGPIVDGIRKAELLDVIAQAESVTSEQVIAVGDGANDLFMLSKAGLGIAFNAKPRVQQQAPARINQRSLKNVLYLLGYTDDEIDELASY
ncbi:phosphoserine phosphatase serb [Piromyces finnis]|uniref:phosphoserine phosphatase n=1 Tax=Piromyces finnis TaxID=1754191 RepID=A0A1Y1V2U7_9FUNG|nr:phosphoserine phosphatase serb [Piromyces finnis]|eukprot:ORX46017.1 phosphoserine phosphatase serb [Piromyces finnis]